MRRARTETRVHKKNNRLAKNHDRQDDAEKVHKRLCSRFKIVGKIIEEKKWSPEGRTARDAADANKALRQPHEDSLPKLNHPNGVASFPSQHAGLKELAWAN